MVSPPTSALNAFLGRQPASNNRRQVTGVACMTVARERSRTEARAEPSTVSSWVAITTEAPSMSGRWSSSTAISKDKVVTDAHIIHCKARLASHAGEEIDD